MRSAASSCSRLPRTGSDASASRARVISTSTTSRAARHRSKEGTLPNFQDVTKDIVALNRWPDRRVTPALRAGVAPGTVDVDLNIEDTLPLHGSIELNNKQSPSTTPLRTSISMRYDNLWQLGHSVTWTYQVSPMNPKDAMVVSRSYLARTEIDWLSVLVYGLTSDSSVATVGGSNVVGPGQVVGGRAVLTLPSRGELFHTLSLGVDYKDFKQSLKLGTDAFLDSARDLCAARRHLRRDLAGRGAAHAAQRNDHGRLARHRLQPRQSSTPSVSTRPRSFITLHADISHTQDFAGGFQLYAKLQGQAADQPLVSSEQFSLGGQDTVRGYLEIRGDRRLRRRRHAGAARSNLAQYLEQKLPNPLGESIKYNAFDDVRFFAFADGGNTRDPQAAHRSESHFDLASYGVGMRMKTLQLPQQHCSSSVCR